MLQQLSSLRPSGTGRYHQTRRQPRSLVFLFAMVAALAVVPTHAAPTPSSDTTVPSMAFENTQLGKPREPRRSSQPQCDLDAWQERRNCNDKRNPTALAPRHLFNGNTRNAALIQADKATCMDWCSEYNQAGCCKLNIKNRECKWYEGRDVDPKDTKKKNRWASSNFPCTNTPATDAPTEPRTEPPTDTPTEPPTGTPAGCPTDYQCNPQWCNTGYKCCGNGRCIPESMECSNPPATGEGSCRPGFFLCPTCGNICLAGPFCPAEPAPTEAPTEPERGCECDLVPCGWCQEGCPPSTCSYESEVDKPGKTDRNGCGSALSRQNKEIFNLGHFPPACRPAVAPIEEPTPEPVPCASCDLVPCGWCQEGCPPSTCTYESEVDKPGKTDRNGCGKKNGIFNLGHLPLACRPN